MCKSFLNVTAFPSLSVGSRAKDFVLTDLNSFLLEFQKQDVMFDNTSLLEAFPRTRGNFLKE